MIKGDRKRQVNDRRLRKGLFFLGDNISNFAVAIVSVNDAFLFEKVVRGPMDLQMRRIKDRR